MKVDTHRYVRTVCEVHGWGLPFAELPKGTMVRLLAADGPRVRVEAVVGGEVVAFNTGRKVWRAMVGLKEGERAA